MFFNAKAFNKPIGEWDTSKVWRMNEMFSEMKEMFASPLGLCDSSAKEREKDEKMKKGRPRCWRGERNI